jgi:hypothetical protein
MSYQATYSVYPQIDFKKTYERLEKSQCVRGGFELFQGILPFWLEVEGELVKVEISSKKGKSTVNIWHENRDYIVKATEKLKTLILNGGGKPCKKWLLVNLQKIGAEKVALPITEGELPKHLIELVGLQRKLEHSRLLVREIISMGSDYLDYSRLSEADLIHLFSIDCALRHKHFMQHIKLGYPEVYEKIKELRRFEKSAKEKYDRFSEAVEEAIRREGFEPVGHPRDLKPDGKQVYSNNVASLIGGIFQGIYGGCGSIKAEAGVNVCGYQCVGIFGVGISRNENLAGELEDLIKKLAGLEELKKAYVKYLKEGKNVYCKWIEVEDLMKHIAWKALHGEPFKDWCDGCPRI